MKVPKPRNLDRRFVSARMLWPGIALAVTLLLCAAPPATSFPISNGTEYALWPSTPPGSVGVSLTETVKDDGKDPVNDPQRIISGIATPTIRAFIPARPNGAAAVITAGGGYTSLVIDKEGTDIAKWLNGIGITAFVLKNRLPGEGHADGSDVPLQDGQRAIRLVRSNAAEWGIDPKRIGIVGLSSGGHMASMIGTSYGRKVYEPVDAGDANSARPDFMILAYGPHSSNARQYLLNPAQAPVPPPQKQALYDEYPTDRQVTKDTPPAFLMHTDEDNRVDPRNSVRFYMALKEAGIPAELHIFRDGPHGVAIRNAKGLPVAAWTTLAEEWLIASGVIKRP